MKKLLLINPVGQRSGTLLSRFSTFPPLGFAYVAAVTPSDWEVKIVDENFDRFQLEEADLVGITAFTTTINRA
ncbi:MAG: radical SAM protein, partial [Desulfobacterales bacterium]|nr:radical SAM protein [Desulfobacterales bacterium]